MPLQTSRCLGLSLNFLHYINILGPIGTEPEVFQKIMKQTCSAADELGIAIVRGHTGMYESPQRFAWCLHRLRDRMEPDKLITPGNANPGDLFYAPSRLGWKQSQTYR